MLALAVIAAVGDADRWLDIAAFWQARLPCIGGYSSMMTARTLAHETFRRLFVLLPFASIQRCFKHWLGDAAAEQRIRRLSTQSQAHSLAARDTQRHPPRAARCLFVCRLLHDFPAWVYHDFRRWRKNWELLNTAQGGALSRRKGSPPRDWDARGQSVNEEDSKVSLRGWDRGK